MHRSPALALCAPLALLLACSPPADPPSPGPVDRVSTAIVGGRAEAGHPAVGALTVEFRGQYFGSFCSATLIAPRWVLTAAHCTEGLREQGVPVAPEIIDFYQGTDARPGRDGARPAGTFHRASAIHLHPGYTGADPLGFYDVALIELRDPVEDTDPYPAYDGDPSNLEGSDVLYVGFGVSDGNRQTGGGVKRSTSLELDRVYGLMYTSIHDGSGVCFGDSGGPGLAQIDGRWQVIGVNSSVGGEPICLDVSLQSRVDAYIGWVRDTMGDGRSCRRAPGACFCDAACGDDGICDNGRCGDGCLAVAGCVSACRDSLCATDCVLEGSVSAVRRYTDVIACGDRSCGDAPDYNACLQRSCADEVAACEDEDEPVDPPPVLDCEALFECLGACADQACGLDCYENTSARGQAAYDDLATCARDCPRDDGYDACMRARCSGEWQACVPPDGCRVTGGTCPGDTACLPDPWGGTYCRQTDGLTEGARCDPAGVSCEDGAFCFGVAGAELCTAVCLDGGDCAGGDCALIEGLGEPLGVCVGCRDADGDGSCADEDCDEGDPASYPGAEEICGDLVDQDCDDRTDEGCPMCNDRDGDGACDADDCADDDPERFPGAAERCDDGVDEDCDGQIDEGCAGCADADGDGICAAIDCDDADAAVGRPEAGGCPCPDVDGDGFCAEIDCDDADPSVHARPCVVLVDPDMGPPDGRDAGAAGESGESVGAAPIGCACDAGDSPDRAPLGAVLALMALGGWRRRLRR